MSQVTPFPPEGVDTGATNTAPGHTDPGTSAGGRTDDLSGSATWVAIQALAALLEPEAFDPDVDAVPEWREPTQAVAYNHAAKVITSGYRLVSEDDATVDRVAAVLAAWDGQDWADLRGRDVDASKWASQRCDHYRRGARAAVRALREER